MDGASCEISDLGGYTRGHRMCWPPPFTIGADSRHSAQGDKSQLARCDYLRAPRWTAHAGRVSNRVLDAGVYSAGKAAGSITPARATGSSDREPGLRAYGGTQHPARAVHRMDAGNGFEALERRRVLRFLAGWPAAAAAARSTGDIRECCKRRDKTYHGAAGQESGAGFG